ncbi:MAG: serine/threonine protein phosphatase [Chitinophagaceae bacterium]|nr:MAG: serine/threonine protein phosphatase [Chitinophagaceae bacterium]
MSRKIVVGDIHGALRGLIQLMDRIKPVYDDEFVFLGDYVDGWPDAAQVVEYLVAFSEKYSCTFILGNHDIWADEWLRGSPPNTVWLKHGGRETIQSYSRVLNTDRHIHLAFYKNLQHFIVDENNRLFVHAGFSTEKGPEADFLDGRYLWDRSLWEEALYYHASDFSYQPSPRLSKYSEIYIGHTPVIFYDFDTPVHAQNLWNLDTGAGFDGKLSAMDIESGKIWQSDPIPALYPGITGRIRH